MSCEKTFSPPFILNSQPISFFFLQASKTLAAGKRIPSPFPRSFFYLFFFAPTLFDRRDFLLPKTLLKTLSYLKTINFNALLKTVKRSGFKPSSLPLYVELKQHHVAVFHNVFFAFRAHLARFFGFYVTAAI